VREQRERERELMELDRDIRTIFAYNLPLKATEKELFQFFSSAGQIGDVRIIVDRNTRKSKGFAYIEYANRVSLSRHLM
jgi:RNA-binding protein 39